MADINAIYNQGKRAYQTALIEAESQYRQADLDGDTLAATEAAMRINDLRARIQSWDGMAQEAIRQQPAKANPYGLSDEEMEVAKNWTSDRLPLDQRLKTYAEQRDRLRQARLDGSYRDDQGRR